MFNFIITMKRLFFILTCVIFPWLFGCTEDSTKEYRPNLLLDFEKGDFASAPRLFCFVHFSPGEYRYLIPSATKGGVGEFEVRIEPLSAGASPEPAKIRLKMEEEKDPVFDFTIREAGYYKIILDVLQVTGINTPVIKVLRGKLTLPLPGTAPSVRFNFHPRQKKGAASEWLYGEISVPVGNDPPFSLSSFGDDQMEVTIRVGSNNNRLIDQYTAGDTDRSVVFTVNGTEEDKRHLLAKGTRARTYNNSILIGCDWETGKPVRLLMNRKTVSDSTVLLSAWFSERENVEWNLIASWLTAIPDQEAGYVYSEVTELGFAPHLLRTSEFGNLSYKLSGGKWTEFRKAELQSADSICNRNDYGGSVRPGSSGKFLLSTGGFLPVEKTKGVVSIGNTGYTPPQVDTDSLSSYLNRLLAGKEKREWNYLPDRKIRVKSGTASDSQPGEGIEQSFDNNSRSLYHSPWNNTLFPVTLTYHFSPSDTIDYLVYYPRSDGGTNGNFKEFELWVKTTEEGDFRKAGDYDLDGNSQPALIRFSQPIIGPESVRFVVKSGTGDNGTGFVSCSEMEFYREKSTSSIPPLFSDISCSALKSGVTQEEIDRIENDEFRELAASLFRKEYPISRRVRNYSPYPKPWKAAEKNRTKSYSMQDNPTGIFVDGNQSIVVFVGETGGENISLRSINFDKSYVCSDYLLKEGLNIIEPKDEGLLYILYHTDNPKAKPIRIHIASGQVNDLFDIRYNTNKDWKEIVDNSACDYLDVLGKYAHLTYAVSDFKRYTPDIERLIGVYDSIVWLESELIGLNKYKRQNRNRMYFFLDPNTPYGGYAAQDRTGYCKGFMPDMCRPERLRTDGIWGAAHEVGHMNQTAGFKWVGMTEVSNNVYAMFVQQAFGNRSRLSSEKLNSDFDGSWNNRYEKGFTEMVAGGVSTLKHGDVFCKLIPFWQLQLYNADVMGYRDFYADVHEQIRRNPLPGTDSEELFQFMKICCDVAKTDFTDFFEKWGFLSVIDENVVDHSSIPNQAYSTRDFSVTREQIDRLIKEASKYKKPDVNIHYLHDECIDTFRKGKEIRRGSVERKGDRIEFKDWENVAVYEVYGDGKLLFVTPYSSFRLPENSPELTIHAVPARGKSIVHNLL